MVQIHIASFISLVSTATLAVVLFIFMSNTRLKIDELDHTFRHKDKIIESNLRNSAIDSNYNSKFLEKQIEEHEHNSTI
jgi:hypothetical protein